MDRPSSSAMVVLVTLLAPIAWALPAPGILDDAASGMDAGNTSSAAMPLAYGSYAGNLTLGDADWFAFPATSAPACLRASVGSLHAMRVGVGADPGIDLVGGLQEGIFQTTLAVAPGAQRLGMLPDESPWDVVSVGPYAFALDVRSPAVLADDGDVVPADCFGAALKDDHVDVDSFFFDANEGDIAVYSAAVGQGSLSVAIKDASGAIVGSFVPSGSAGQVTIPVDGTYTLTTVGRATGGNQLYTAALVVGPEPSGCRPYCLGAL